MTLTCHLVSHILGENVVWIFDRNLIKLAGNEDSHQILDEFDVWADRSIGMRAICPWGPHILRKRYSRRYQISIRLMKIIFHMKPKWEGRMKLYSNDQDGRHEFWHTVPLLFGVACEYRRSKLGFSTFRVKQFILILVSIISSPEYEVLKVSYCDQCPSSLSREASTICFKSLLLLHPWTNWLET